MGSRFIHLIRTDSNAFLFLAEYYSIAELFFFFLSATIKVCIEMQFI